MVGAVGVAASGVGAEAISWWSRLVWDDGVLQAVLVAGGYHVEVFVWPPSLYW